MAVKTSATEKSEKNENQAGKESAKAAEKRNLDLALQSIVKTYGENAIMRLGDAAAKLKIDVVPTGCFAIDQALGAGGFPRGRIIEIFGPESSGKTTLTLTAIANAQKQGGTAAFIDVEHALDPSYARKLGVNMDELLVSQPDSGEEALNIAETLIRSNALDVVVLDSVAALVTKNELEGQIGDVTVGAQARLMSAAMRKLTALISRARTVAIFTNQIREKIGVMFGSPETTPGGRALKFYASVRVDIRRITAIKQPGTDGRHLHQSDPRKDRGDVWESGNDPGRAGSEVLRECACGHSTNHGDQAAGRNRCGKPDEGEDREEQSGTPLHGGGIRHHV